MLRTSTSHQRSQNKGPSHLGRARRPYRRAVPFSSGAIRLSSRAMGLPGLVGEIALFRRAMEARERPLFRFPFPRSSTRRTCWTGEREKVPRLRLWSGWTHWHDPVVHSPGVRCDSHGALSSHAAAGGV
jgi:hypothetical protein